MRSVLLVAGVLLVLGAFASSQSFNATEISVVNSVNGTPVFNASIQFNDSVLGVQQYWTDVNGNASVQIDTGILLVAVTAPGYYESDSLVLGGINQTFRLGPVAVVNTNFSYSEPALCGSYGPFQWGWPGAEQFITGYCGFPSMAAYFAYIGENASEAQATVAFNPPVAVKQPVYVFSCGIMSPGSSLPSCGMVKEGS